MGHTLEPLTGLMAYVFVPALYTDLCTHRINSILQRLLRLVDPPYAAVLEE
jgi:hypothetical protein